MLELQGPMQKGRSTKLRCGSCDGACKEDKAKDQIDVGPEMLVNKPKTKGLMASFNGEDRKKKFKGSMPVLVIF